MVCKKEKRKRRTTGIVLAVLAMLFCGMEASAGTSVSLEIPVTQEWTVKGTAPEEAGTFQYKLLPLEEGNPMPKDKKEYTFEIAGNRTVKLEPIEYHRTGIYTYQLMQVLPEEKAKGYTYDEEVYTIQVYVVNKGEDLATEIVIQDASGSKSGEILFRNKYEKIITSVHREDVKTGDNTSNIVYLELLVLSAGVFCFLLIHQKIRQKNVS